MNVRVPEGARPGAVDQPRPGGARPRPGGDPRGGPAVEAAGCREVGLRGLVAAQLGVEALGALAVDLATRLVDLVLEVADVLEQQLLTRHLRERGRHRVRVVKIGRGDAIYQGRVCAQERFSA